MPGKLNPGASAFVPGGSGDAASSSSAAAQGHAENNLSYQNGSGTHAAEGHTQEHRSTPSTAPKKSIDTNNVNTSLNGGVRRQYDVNTLLSMRPRQKPPRPSDLPKVETVPLTKDLLGSNLTPSQLTNLFAHHPAFKNGIPPELPQEKVFQMISQADNVPFILHSNPMWKSYIKEISVRLQKRIGQSYSKKNQHGKHKNGNVSIPSTDDIARALLQTTQLYDHDGGQFNPAVASGQCPPDSVAVASKQLVDNLPYQPLMTLVQQFSNFAENVFTGASSLETVVDAIFQKSIRDPKHCELCAKLCTELVISLPEFLEQGRLCSFRKFLLMRCYSVIVELGQSNVNYQRTSWNKSSGQSLHGSLQLSALASFHSRKLEESRLHCESGQLNDNEANDARNQASKIAYPYPFRQRSIGPSHKVAAHDVSSWLWSTTMASQLASLGDGNRQAPIFSIDECNKYANQNPHGSDLTRSKARSASEDHTSSEFPALPKERKTEERYCLFLALLYRYNLITENLIRMALSRLLDPPITDDFAHQVDTENISPGYYIPSRVPGEPAIEAACELLLCAGGRLERSGHAGGVAVSEYVEYLRGLLALDDEQHRENPKASGLSVRTRHKILQVYRARQNAWEHDNSRQQIQQAEMPGNVTPSKMDMKSTSAKDNAEKPVVTTHGEGTAS